MVSHLSKKDEKSFISSKYREYWKEAHRVVERELLHPGKNTSNVRRTKFHKIVKNSSSEYSFCGNEIIMRTIPPVANSESMFSYPG